MITSDRRTFVKGAALGLAATFAVKSTARAAGANERVVVGAIGCGGQGSNLARSFAGLANVEVAYVCDPDDSRAGRMADEIGQSHPRPKAVSDLRRVLDDPAVNMVTVATPDHWHAPAAILACAAGKHVYVEKPCAHNLHEGRLLVSAAKHHGRLVQHGTQSRSSALVRHAVQLLRDGVIGRVHLAKAWDVQLRDDIGRAQPSEPPSGFDYDMWLGPAPYVPFQANRHHYTWHWWYDFGTGDMGNDGVHEIDIARWGLGVEHHPSAISAMGAKLHFRDDQQFPDTQVVMFDYPAADGNDHHRQLMFELRIWSRYGMDGIDNGNSFYGEDGWMLLAKRGILKVFDRSNKPVEIPAVGEETTGHHQNMVDAVRGDAALAAPIEIGHVSASLCHLGNIAARLGRNLRFDGANESFPEDVEAQQLLTRKYRDGHWSVPTIA